MPSSPKKKRGSRKAPAYPRVGTGEDFPARRPGTRIGEDAAGNKILQPTRATTQRRTKGAPRRPALEFLPHPPKRPQGMLLPRAGARPNWSKGGKSSRSLRRSY